MTSSAPEATVAAWAEAWRQLDADAVFDLFTADATYVAALSGAVPDLRRSFTAATRTWTECRLDDLEMWPEGEDSGVASVRATYQFLGVTRRGTEVTYAAAADFRLRAIDGDWRIQSFVESLLPDSDPGAAGSGVDTL